MSNNNKKRRAREIANAIVSAPHEVPIQKELGELVLELIEEPKAPTIAETGWKFDYEGMIAIDCDGDEVILLYPREAFDDDSIYRVLWKNQEDRFIVLGHEGRDLRPTGRYASASSVLTNKEDQA